MTSFDPFKDKIASDYIDIMRYSQAKQPQLKSLIKGESIPSEIKAIAESGQRIGYMVRSCCPFTKVDIELAQQAVERLNLDKLVFIIWPFRHENEYDTVLIDGENFKKKTFVWEERIAILKRGLETVNDDKLTLLEASKEWYIQSKQMSDEGDSMNPFWTGTWFVIRKLQFLMNQLSAEKKTFFYCCEENEFNPNIYPLIREGQEKIWKNYSILQHLGIHHVFVVPIGDNSLQNFSVPAWSQHEVIIGAKLKRKSVASLKGQKGKTINMVNVGCVGGVMSHLIRLQKGQQNKH